MRLIEISEVRSVLESKGIALTYSGHLLTPSIPDRLQYMVEVCLHYESMALPQFVDTFLCAALGEWQDCWLWKRAPQWSPYESGRLVHRLRDFMVRDLIPDGFEGAVQLSRMEMGTLYRLAVAQFLCSNTQADDIYVVPDSEQPSFFVLEHHGFATLHHADEGTATHINEALRQKGLDAHMWNSEDE